MQSAKQTKKTAEVTKPEVAKSDRGLAKHLEGTVVSNKMAKTIVVSVVRNFKHPRYGKYVHKTNKFYVHDEKQEAKIGDKVEIVETRRLSRTKHFKLAKVLVKAAEV